jgi:hypothetical protein
LSQFRLPSEIMQPSSVRVSPCLWFSSHTTARIIPETERIQFLSTFRQSCELNVDRNLEYWENAPTRKRPREFTGNTHGVTSMNGWNCKGNLSSVKRIQEGI